jgi:restriction endonuclease S subunit
MWKTVKLVDLCRTLHQGLNTAGEKIAFVEDGFPIIQTRNISEKGIDITSKLKYLSTSDWEKYRKKYKPEVGDVFFTNIGTIGKTAIVTEEMDYLIHWNIFKIRPDSKLCTPEFLKTYLDYLTAQKYFQNLQKGGTVNFVTKKMISEVIINLPPLAEQQRIVAKLDAAFAEIDTAIEAAEKCVTDAIAIYDTHLDRKFSDLSSSHPKHLMHDACDLIDSLHKTPKYTDDGYPMIRVADVKPGRINFDNAKRVDENTFKEFSKRHTAEIGDIILSRVGSYGVSAIVSGNVEFCLGQNTVFIIPKGNSKYLYYFLNSPFAQRQMDSLISGVAQPTISLKSIKSLTIPLPNEKTQIEISVNFEKLWLETQNVSKIFKEKCFQLVKLKSAILAQELQSETA